MLLDLSPISEGVPVGEEVLVEAELGRAPDHMREALRVSAFGCALAHRGRWPPSDHQPQSDPPLANGRFDILAR